MKSFVVCIVFVALVGGVLSGKQRRQAPAGVIPDDVAGSIPADGPPEGITTEKPTTGDKLNAVVAGMLAKMNAEAALGIPPNPKDVDKVLKLGMVIGIVGGELTPENQEGINNLLTAPAEAPADSA